MNKLISVTFFLLVLVCCFSITPVFAEPVEKIEKDIRCSICGMFVAKYPIWISQIRHKSGKIEYFDGVKDMMVYFFNPQQYGGAQNDELTEVWTKDYYSLEWLDARKSFFVVGSDVYGPMGHEFIPFGSMPAAESFKKDHKGKEILTFLEITDAKAQAMRVGHKMK
jgi:copper chaperone NosL